MGKTIALTVGLLLVGCGGSSKLDALADEACQCKDAACGKAVYAKFSAWAAENNGVVTGDDKQAEASLERMTTCIAKVYVPK